MSKLREKFEEIIDNSINDFSSKWQSHDEKSFGITENSEQCEQITDDFSVKFIEWKDKLQLESKIGLMDRGFSIYMESGKEPISVTTTELLQIFKTEYYEK